MIFRYTSVIIVLIITLLFNNNKVIADTTEKTLGHQFTKVKPAAKNIDTSKQQTKKDEKVLNNNLNETTSTENNSPLTKQDVNKKTLSHQFSTTPNLLPHTVKKQNKTLTKKYFETLGHRYTNQSFRQSLQNKNKNSKNRQLAHDYLSTLGHKFGGSNISSKNTQNPIQGKRLNNQSLTTNVDDHSSRFLENEELLLIAQIDEYILDAVFGYKSGNGALIGLDNLFAVIDFPIIVNTENRTASGWFIEENQKFELSIPNDNKTPARAIINGITYQIPRSLIRVEDDDIYLHTSYLSKIFDIGFDVNFKDLLLLISPKKVLPLQAKFRRRAKLGKLSVGKMQPPQLPFRETPYELFSVPLVDVQTSYSTNNNNDRASYSLVGMGDLAYMTGSYFVNGDDEDAIKNFRLNLQRESMTNDLLGPLNASRVALGDISPASIPLLATSSQEVGFNISNRSLGLNNNNRNTTSFVGDLLPGWDVEIYHNNILLEVLTVDDSGRYEFKDLDLYFGENIFKMIFYGPQGQKRERIENIPVTTNTLLKQKTTYDLSITKQNDSLFESSQLEEPLIDSYRTALALEQGITNNLSLQSGFSNYQFANGEEHSFVPFGVNYYLPIAKFNVNYIKDLDAGDSFKLAVKSKIRQSNIDFNYQQFDEDFRIDSDDLTNNKNNLSLRLSGPLYKRDGLALTYSLSASNATNYNDITTSTFNSYIGAFMNKFSITNTLNYIDIKVDDNTKNQIFRGSTQFTKTFDSIRWRSTIGYSFEPEAELTNASTSLFWVMSPDFSSEFGLSYNTSATNASYRLNWDTEHAIVSANFSVDDNDNYQALLSMRFSFGQDPTSGDIQIGRDRIAAAGGISARIFEDTNLDGLYNQGEPLIEGAKLLGVQSRRHIDSQESGIAFLTGLPKNRITDIKLDIDSLENPFWVPVEKGFSFLPRPGAVESIDIPVVTSGEIEGTILLTREDGKQLPGRYIPLQLLDDEKNIVQETDSEFDGFYLFIGIKPGDYLVRVSPSYLEKNKLTMDKERHQANILGDGTIVRGLDFLLESPLKAAINNPNGYTINLGTFASNYNRLLTYKLLMNQYPRLRGLPVIMSKKSPYSLIINSSNKSASYVELCNNIMKRNLTCKIQ